MSQSLSVASNQPHIYSSSNRVQNLKSPQSIGEKVEILGERLKKRYEDRIEKTSALFNPNVELKDASKLFIAKTKLELEKDLRSSLHDLKKIIKILEDDRSKKLLPILREIFTLGHEFVEDENSVKELHVVNDSTFKQLNGMLIAADVLKKILILNNLGISEINSFLNQVQSKYQTKQFELTESQRPSEGSIGIFGT